jgi:AcrR family transcriptional regulator
LARVDIRMVFRWLSSRRPIAPEPATAESILTAATTVLAERGQTGFTAARVASAAGVSPATFRRHFADVTELLRELIERDARRRAQIGLSWLMEQGASAHVANLERIVHGFIALMIDSRRRDPVSTVLRELARTTPGLTSVDDGWHADWIPPFSNFLLWKIPALSPTRAAVVARFVATLHVFVIDLVITNPELEAAILAEWAPLLVAYFTRLANTDGEGESDRGQGT